jgi:hypothetical protein
VPQTVKSNSSNWTLDPTPTDATIGYAHSTSNNQFVSLPLPGGTPLSVIGAQAYADFAGGGCFGGDGLFYVSTVGNTSGTPQIWTQDISTGVATLVGPTGLSSAEGFNGIAYDWTTGIYYGASGANLYTFDNTTGTATLVGPLNNTGGLAIDIAIDCAGNMYMHDLGLDNIYSVNKATGAATLIGPTGFDANFGQGMGYDHDDGTLYLFAFNNTAFTAQLRTVDVTTGNTTLVFDYGLDQHAPFDGQAGCGPGCPVGAPSNPSPANGAVDIPVSGNTASWTNGAGTTAVEVYFGEPGNLQLVYDGTPISSLSLAGVEPLEYFTVYGWRVVDKNDTCGTSGPTWTFRTIQDPNLNCVFTDDFEGGLTAWTITNLGGTCDWLQFFPPYPNAYTMPATSSGGVLSADSDECGSGTTINTAAQIGPFDASLYLSGYVKFDQDFNAIGATDECYVEVSVDGGTTWTPVWSQIGVDLRATTEQVDISTLIGQMPQFWVRFRSVQPGWDWWWTIDNVEVCLYDFIPVELTSFIANASEGLVELSWITATETNNQGFEVQRSSNGEFETIAFVDGHGTTTESQAYSYSDRNVGVGSYSYRLKQIDLDGRFEYSDIVEVDVPAPAEFGLDQNYPNPFNPSTTINFRLAVDSKVTLKIFDVLGQEVASLVNGNLGAGAHQVDFNASALNSGVYLYKIEATGTDGTNFSSVKKMILTK